ncbi:MAG: class I SAM-dependent RNA methyltransferase [Saprospiraceae bacterium]|nr:class I SAM-dependent RNA methyltransferase [Saprospiraceae bacterium]
MNHYYLLAKTQAGLEGVLADELRAIGATGIRELKRAVAYEGDKRVLYRSNYELRTASRILVEIHEFGAFSEKDLYEAVRDIDWTEFMGINDTLAVDAVTSGEVFKHSKYAALLAKDAVVDQFRDRFDRRPNVQQLSPTLRIHIHIQGTHGNILLDASDEALFKRGYRKDTVDAPINEILAAGLVLLSGWNGLGPFVDPMCGSGTIPIEAALIARNIPIQYKRQHFGFLRWPDFDETLWKSVKEEAQKRITPFEFPIIASDIDGRARNATAMNVMSAGLEEDIRIEKMPFDKLVPPDGIHGTLIANPPYDERMLVDDTTAFYRSIGDRFKKSWAGWNAWLISSNREALKQVGLRPSKRITLFNGPLECSFQKFEMYEGRKVE